MWALLWLTFLPGIQTAVNDPWLVIPGKQVGPITVETTARDLIRIYGGKNVRSSKRCVVMDGMFVPCMILFENTNRQVRILLGDGRRVEIHGDNRWRTPEGVRIGLTAQDLVQRNGTGFEYQAFSACGPDKYIISWGGGNLESTLQPDLMRLYVSTPRQHNAVDPQQEINPKELSSHLPAESRVIRMEVLLLEIEKAQ